MLTLFNIKHNNSLGNKVKAHTRTHYVIFNYSRLYIVFTWIVILRLQKIIEKYNISQKTDYMEAYNKLNKYLLP